MTETTAKRITAALVMFTFGVTALCLAVGSAKMTTDEFCDKYGYNMDDCAAFVAAYE